MVSYVIFTFFSCNDIMTNSVWNIQNVSIQYLIATKGKRYMIIKSQPEFK